MTEITARRRPPPGSVSPPTPPKPPVSAYDIVRFIKGQRVVLGCVGPKRSGGMRSAHVFLLGKWEPVGDFTVAVEAFDAIIKHHPVAETKAKKA